MQNLSTTDQHQRLFERGLVCLEPKDSPPVDIKRGMTILTKDGQDTGWVAAVVLDCNNQHVSHILLTHVHLTADYRLVPINFIKQVNQETVLLNVDREAVEGLPHKLEEHL